MSPEHDYFEPLPCHPGTAWPLPEGVDHDQLRPLPTVVDDE